MAFSSRGGGIGETGSFSSSSSGQKFLPWQEQAAQKVVGQYTNLLGALGDRLGSQQSPGGGGDFASYFQNIGGPAAQFTGVPITGVWTPQMLDQATNALWADNDARMASQSRNIMQGLGPGISSNSPLLAELQANNQGRFGAIGANAEQGLRQRAAIANAQHELAQRGLNLNVEAQRAGDDLNRRSLALTGRAQDFQRENALWGLLAGGLGGAGGLLTPLSSSTSASMNYTPGTTISYGRPRGRPAGANIADYWNKLNTQRA